MSAEAKMEDVGGGGGRGREKDKLSKTGLGVIHELGLDWDDVLWYPGY